MNLFKEMNQGDSIFEQDWSWRFAILIGCFIFGLLAYSQWQTLDTAFRDTDDALRLVEVRDWIAGQSFFDLRQWRLNPPAGLESHWSRLIDVPIALLLNFFSTFFEQPLAEKLATIIWPGLCFVYALTLVALITRQLGGQRAFTLCALLGMVNIAGFVQFVPGRIDHHNVQIILTMLMLYALIAGNSAKYGFLAALACSFSLAIGMENLPSVLLTGLLIVFLWLKDPASRKEFTRAYGLLIAFSTIALLFSLRGAQSFASHCDVLGLNYATGVFCGGLGLYGVASLLGQNSFKIRLSILILIGLTSAGIFAFLNPICIAGPMADVDKRIIPIWLDQVIEAQTIVQSFKIQAILTLTLTAFTIVVLPIALFLFRSNMAKLDKIGIAVIFIIANACVGFIQIRGFAFVAWLILPLASLIIMKWAAQNPSAYALRALIFFFILNPAGIPLIATGLAQSLGEKPPLALEKQACFTKAAYEPLKQLPKGLFIAQVDRGPYILQQTAHSAVAGPYHRLGDAIYDSTRFFSGTFEEAHTIATRWKVDYVLQCRDERAPDKAQQPYEVLTSLVTGKTPKWLVEIKGADDAPFKIYRVVK